jgi:hypothetical protein
VILVKIDVYYLKKSMKLVKTFALYHSSMKIDVYYLRQIDTTAAGYTPTVPRYQALFKFNSATLPSPSVISKLLSKQPDRQLRKEPRT